MAKKDKPAKVTAEPGARGSKLAEKQAADAKLDLASYATKDPTDLHVRFASWLKAKTGIKFNNKKEEAVFDRAVSIATALRMPFQRSDENQTANAQRAAARQAAASAPKEKAAKAPKAAKGKKAEQPAEPEPAEVVTPPAKAAKKAAKKATPAATSVAETPVTEAVASTEAKPAAKRAPRKAGAKSKAPF